MNGVMERLGRVLRLLPGRIGVVPQPGEASPTDVLDHYVAAMPSARTAIDAVPGWNHPFPEDVATRPPWLRVPQDERILWCLSQAGAMDGRTVLELGPLEGLHTALLAHSGAAHIDAVEANTLAFVRCLISREILGTRNVSFLLGDFTEWMKQPGRHYDLVVASGVLYHSSDPIGLLDLIAGTADSFYLWTHYFDGAAMQPDDLRRVPFSGRVVQRSHKGYTADLHERSYFKAWRDPKFCGGIQDQHFWMTRDGILDLVDVLGFDTSVAHDEPAHVNGPCFSVFARRRVG